MRIGSRIVPLAIDGIEFRTAFKTFGIAGAKLYASDVMPADLGFDYEEGELEGILRRFIKEGER